MKRSETHLPPHLLFGGAGALGMFPEEAHGLSVVFPKEVSSPTCRGKCSAGVVVLA